MEVTLKQAFNLLDGRLSTNMSDIYDMLNYIFTENFQTIALPMAMDRLKEINPKWFSNGVEFLDQLKEKNNTNDFTKLMEIIDSEYSDVKITLDKIN